MKLNKILWPILGFIAISNVGMQAVEEHVDAITTTLKNETHYKIRLETQRQSIGKGEKVKSNLEFMGDWVAPGQTIQYKSGNAENPWAPCCKAAMMIYYPERVIKNILPPRVIPAHEELVWFDLTGKNALHDDLVVKIKIEAQPIKLGYSSNPYPFWNYTITVTE